MPHDQVHLRGKTIPVTPDANDRPFPGQRPNQLLCLLFFFPGEGELLKNLPQQEGTVFFFHQSKKIFF